MTTVPSVNGHQTRKGNLDDDEISLLMDKNDDEINAQLRIIFRKFTDQLMATLEKGAIKVAAFLMDYRPDINTCNSTLTCEPYT